MIKSKIKLKLLTALTSVAMVTSMTPAIAFANDDVETTDEATTEVTQEVDEGITTQDVDAQEDDSQDTDTEGVYVMLNIPYSEFYAAETTNNSVGVDVFTSATQNKAKTKSMAYGTYHTQIDSSNPVIIQGVSFPVKVSDISILSSYQQITDDDVYEVTVTNRGTTSTTKYEGKDALFGIGGDYAYYVLSETPSFYKELTVNENDGTFSFGAIQGEETVIENVDSEFMTESSYGDFQLNLDDDVITEYFDHDDDAIYGATVNTTDGTKYGLRALENIWLGSQLAWCSTDAITSIHNCPTSYEHYASMMGKTVESVTYYTSNGIYTFKLAETQTVGTKLTTKVTVEDANMIDGETSISFSEDLPADFDAEYSFSGAENVSVEGDVLSFTAKTAGSKTLLIHDASGKYVDLKATFTLTKADKVAKYNSKDLNPALVACKNIDDDMFSTFISNITVVTVDDTDYAASGRGAATIINTDGSINLAATSNNKAIFSANGDYEITVKSTGFRNVTFTIDVYDEETYMASSVPGNVSGVKASATANSVSLSWDAVDGAAGYNVYRGSELIATVDGTSYTDSNLETGATYSYSIKATKEYSNKLDSNTQTIESANASEVSATCALKAPTAKAKAGKKSATISWSAVDSADGYEVYRSTKKSSGFSKVKTTAAGTVKYTNKKLKKGKTYYFKVRAYKTVNGSKVYSNYSSVVKAKAK